MPERIGDRRRLEALPGGGWAYALIDEAVRIEARYLRRERGQLYAELDVQCEWAGARVYRGSLSCATQNLSSQSARKSLAEYCAKRAQTAPEAFDWHGAIDAACMDIIQAERQGDNGLVLDDAPIDGPPRDFLVYGLPVPADSNSQLISDGGGLKSLILLLVLGELAQQGIPVCFVDFEWNAARHLARKRRLFGDQRLESLFYLRGRHDIAGERDHLRRFFDTHQIAFWGLDSISAAVDGKLADDDVARAFNRAIDGLPPCLSTAHVPKNAEPGADLKAFGSAFFHNYTRMSWSVSKQPMAGNEDIVSVLLKPHKQNDGQRVKPVALEFTFARDSIGVRQVDPVAVEGLSSSLPLHVRMAAALKGGSLTIARLAAELEAKPDSVIKALKRGEGRAFVCRSGPDGIDRWGLIERRTA